MTSCAIIISHYESVNFLHTAIRQIRKYKHSDIEQTIYIADQSCEETFRGIDRQYDNDKDIVVVGMKKKLWSGYGVDFIMRYCRVDEEFVCQLHADSFPIHPNWLYLPIKLIEEKKLSFAGQLQCISKANDTIYPPSKGFFAMAQCFNVAKTETYRSLSLVAGFTRFHNRPQSGMEWMSDDWAEWAKEDYGARGSDDDIVAFHWQDKHLRQDKLGLAITGFIEPSFGRVIDDLVFHFGSARESIGVFDSMSNGYKRFTNKINNGYSDELIEEMVSLAKANRPPQTEILRRNHWDGKLKVSTPPSDAINKRIGELKNMQHGMD
jgi:hypothetical protein